MKAVKIMARTKVFGKRDDKLPSTEPVEFTLLDQVFKAKEKRNGATVLRFIASVTDEEAAAGAILPFINDCLLDDEERKRFEALTNDDDQDVELSDLVEIASWLSEVYSSRPTKQ